MRILLIDDDPERIEKFQNMFEEHNIDICWNMDEGIEHAKAVIYDIIFVNHSIESQSNKKNASVYRESLRFAKSISKSENCLTPIILYGSDVIGAYKINQILPHAIKLPFVGLSKNIVTSLMRTGVLPC